MNCKFNPAGRWALAFMLANATASAVWAGEVDIAFDPANFTPGAQITNPYWPLLPGTAAVYTSEGEDGCSVNQVLVTGSVKNDFTGTYSAISAWEIEDRAWLDEECSGDFVLVEETRDWYAQDHSGNVWYFGEDTVSYDGDECPSSEGSFEAGLDGAEAGIIMLAEPRVGDSYQQEFYEDEAEDMARVLRTDSPVSIDFGDYAGCLKTKEWTPLERGEIEHKYYCPEGGGLMLIEELKGKTLIEEFIGNSLPEGDFPTEGTCAE